MIPQRHDATGLERGRVLLCLDKLSESFTGLERFSLQLARGLADLQPEDVEFDFLAPRDRWQDLPAVPRDRLIPLTWWRRSRFTRPVSALHPLRGRGRGSGGYAVWHALEQEAKYLPPDPRIPVLLTIHDLTALELASGRARARRLARLRRNAIRAAAVVTDSSHVANEVRLRLDVDREIEVIPLGVDLDAAGPAERPSGPLPENFLLAVGRVVSYKNADKLVAMLEHLPGMGLVVAGDDSDPYADRLRVRIRETGLGQRARVLGPVSESQRLWLYRNARGLAHPSSYEGFGLPVVEAMRCGLPVFVLRASSLPEVGGDLAFYWDDFDPAGMAALVRRGLREAEGQGYRDLLIEWSKRFTWRRTCLSYLALYRRLLTPGAVV